MYSYNIIIREGDLFFAHLHKSAGNRLVKLCRLFPFMLKLRKPDHRLNEHTALALAGVAQFNVATSELHALNHHYLATVPGLPRSVHILIMRMRQTFKASLGKAWDDSSREVRTGVGQCLVRVL